MLSQSYEQALTRHGDRIAVSDATATATYRDLLRRADQTAAALTGALGRRDRRRVGIAAENSVDYVVTFLALIRLGWVPFLLDTATTPADRAAIAADCGIEVMIEDPATAAMRAFPPAGEVPELLADTEVCRFTSGSTGRPNCIEFSGRAVRRAAENWAAGTGLDGDDRTACFAALSNGLAFNTSLLATFLAGGQLSLHRGLPTAGRVVAALERTGATRLVAFPALYESVVRRDGLAREGFARVTMAISSAAPLAPPVRARFTELTGVPVMDYYGTAETGPLTFGRTTGLGPPLPGVRLRTGTADAPGPVSARSESMGSRYLNAPGLLESRIDAEGFYSTGDTGHLAPDGGLVLTGRSGRVVNVGGRKIDPIEVCDALRGYEGVRDAAAFEVDDRHGSPVLAAVVAADPPIDPLALRAHLGARLAEYKVPSLLRCVTALPSGSSGKPSLSAMRALFAPGKADADV